MHAVTAAARADASLNVVLSPTHDAWIEEARRVLVPSPTPDVPYWDRWSAACYLNDRFLERFRIERSLVSGLRLFVTIREMDMLEVGAERVARLRLVLDRICRRHGTAAEFVAMTPELLKALELWCVEIELTCGRFQRDAVPVEVRRLLDHLEAPPLRLSLR